MAKAASNIPEKWVLISRLLNDIAPHERAVAERRLLDDILAKRCRVRYLRYSWSNGERHVDDMPDHFLRYGRIGKIWSDITLHDDILWLVEVMFPEARWGCAIDPKAWITESVSRRMPGERVTDFARRVEPEMARAHKAGECRAAWQHRTIVNQLKKLGLS